VLIARVAVERGAALVTGQIARSKHRSPKDRQPSATSLAW
jgi:hypothetical protein